MSELNINELLKQNKKLSDTLSAYKNEIKFSIDSAIDKKVNVNFVNNLYRNK